MPAVPAGDMALLQLRLQAIWVGERCGLGRVLPFLFKRSSAVGVAPYELACPVLVSEASR
jgi:hypothetical protein